MNSTAPERLRVRFAVRRRYQHGTALPEREWRAQRPVLCTIQLYFLGDGQGGPSVRVASCTAPGDSLMRRLVPDLYEVELNALGEQGFLLEGYERVAEAPDQPPHRFRQAWHVRFCA